MVDRIKHDAPVLVIGLGQISLGTAVGLEKANEGGNIQALANILFSHYVFAFETTSALLITAAIGAMVLAHRERLTPKDTQAARAAQRMQDYSDSGKHPGPLPSPGVFARHNAVDTPALLPDGSPSELSVSRVLSGPDILEFQHMVREVIVTDEIARYAVHRHELPGVLLETRMARHYPYGTVGAHALGYVGTISADDLERVDRERYFGTGVIGKTGVERAYESDLLGTGGYREVLVNAEGRPAKLAEGVDPQLTTHQPQAGKDLRMTIDIELQYDIANMFHRAKVDSKSAAQPDAPPVTEVIAMHGAAVLIDIPTGGVLAMVSYPTFDLNDFNEKYAPRFWSMIPVEPP